MEEYRFSLDQGTIVVDCICRCRMDSVVFGAGLQLTYFHVPTRIHTLLEFRSWYFRLTIFSCLMRKGAVRVTDSDRDSLSQGFEIKSTNNYLVCSLHVF